MPFSVSMPQPAAARRAGLIAVDGRTYPLRSTHLRSRAEGGIAATTLTQTFRNPYAEPLDVRYALPLPADGAVTGYTIRLGERVIRGEVRSRETARDEYRKALVDGRTAALLEQDRDDTFTQQLGCVPAGVEVGVEIELIQPLAFLVGDGANVAPRWELRFPTVVGVRYHGDAGRVPDAERLSPDRADGAGTPARFEYALTIADGSPDELGVSSPSHELHCREESSATLVESTADARLDRDFVLRWLAGSERVGLRLVEGPGLPGDIGRYGLVTITPPAVDTPTLRRDLTLLIDASGSMSGPPLARAKKIAAELLRGLEPGDRFEILAFASVVERMSRETIDASRVASGLAWLDAVEAGGATEMNRAVIEALCPLREDSQRQVVLVTDGYIGFEHDVVGTVMRELPAGSRVHTVGVGAAPNRTLTRSLARAGRGVEVIGDDDDVTDAARRLSRATVRPVLTDIELRGSALVQHCPVALPDVLAGQPLRVACELQSTGGTLELRGRLAGADDDWVRTIEIPVARPKAASGDLPIGALFGRERISDLQVRQAAHHDEMDALNEEIEVVGLRHRIAGPRTSLVAFAEEPTVDPNAPKRRERLAVELPAGVSAEGVGLPAYCVTLDAPISGLRMLDDQALSFQELQSWEVASYTRPSFLEARVLSCDEHLLIIELESPEDGFELPSRAPRLHVGGSKRSAAVVLERSSPLGPHPCGRTLRLALRPEDGRPWVPGEYVLRAHGKVYRFIVTTVQPADE